MKKISVFITAILSIFVWTTFAANPSIINHSYTVDGSNIKIYWTDNSNWWNVDINVQNPTTQDRMAFGSAKISDQVFSYVKQREWDQKIWMIPDDWWDEVQFTIYMSWTSAKPTVTRTVIPVTPKTWPSWNIIWIIIATFAIFGGYIYIKRKADL